jgi:hypothetical protein
MWESPPAPSSASSPAPSVVDTVLVRVEESLDNGIQDNGGDDARPQRIEHDEGKCSDEQPDHPVFVRVTVKHQGCCVSTASSSPLHTKLLQPSIKRATGAGEGARVWGSMVAFVSAVQFLTAGQEIIFPSRRPANFNQDIRPKKRLDLHRQLSFISLHRGIADPEGFSRISE